jgi:hypothetical protein
MLDQNSQAPRPDFDAERLKTIAARCAEAIDDAHFTLGRPVVNLTSPIRPSVSRFSQSK